ncbi:hypothetical protein CsatB_002896 [Cannabis sativa]
MSVKNPLDALAALRTQKGLIDLVVTDLHMPYMNGFQLQELIEKEFQLPVIMMSVDDKDTVLLKSAQSGVVFFISKPVSLNDLKYVWQHVIKYKRGKSVVTKHSKYNSNHHDDAVTNNQKQVGDILNDVGESRKDENIPYDPNNKIINNHNIIDEDEDGDDDMESYSKNKNNTSSSLLDYDHETDDQVHVIKSKGHKKKKVVWTNSLHNSFLLAIGHLGLEKAVPKKILEYMNIPGLTRENVASHLQKYRLFMKKVSEKGSLNETKTNMLASRMCRSTFAMGYQQELLLNKAHQIPFSSLSQFYSTHNNYNINNINYNNHHIWPYSSSSSPPWSTTSLPNPIDFSETNYCMATNPYDIVNNNCSYSNGFSNEDSSSFNGIVQNRPDYNSITSCMRGHLLSSTNDALYHNYINGNNRCVPNSLGGIYIPHIENNENQIMIDGGGGQQSIEFPNCRDGLMENNIGVLLSNENRMNEMINMTNYDLQQQSASCCNYDQPSPVVEPVQPSLQQHCYDVLPNLDEQYSNEIGDDDSNNLSSVINNESTFTASLAGELPVPNDVLDDIIDELFPLDFQDIDVMNPSLENKDNNCLNQNPGVDQLSGNIATPYVVQENEQQGMEEFLNSTATAEQFINFPTHKLNEMDWDEFLDNMLDNKYPGPLE